MVPMLRCGLVRSNLALAMAVPYSLAVRELFAANALDDFFGNRLRYLLVRVELHGVRRATLGARTEVSSVAEHLSEGHLGVHHVRRASLFHPLDPTTARREVADDVAHVVLGGDDLDVLDRLEQHGLGRPGRLLERHGAGDLERHLAGVDVVVRAEGEDDAHVDEGVTGDDAALHRLLDPGVDGGDVLPRDDAARDLVDELVTAAGPG